MVANAPEMPGIRIYGSPWPKAPRADPAVVRDQCRLLFSVLFRSILPELSKHRWFLPDGLETFAIPDSWYEGEPGETKIEQMSRLLVYAPGQRGFDYYFAETVAAIEAWLPYVDLDWNEIYVLNGDCPSRDEIVRLQDEQPVPIPCPDAALVAWAKAYFYSYEGCYWSCYSREQPLLEAVKADLTSSWGAVSVDYDDLRNYRVPKEPIKIVNCTLLETQRLHEP